MEFLPIETLFTRERKLPSGHTVTYVSRAMGGGPAISGSMWGRADPSNYDEWAALGNAGWSYEELLPYFRAAESYRDLFDPGQPVSEERGLTGPIQVASVDENHPVLRVLLETASRAFELPRRRDYSTREGIEGFFPMQRNLGHDASSPRRSTPYTAYVQPHLARENLRVVDMATVVRIHIDPASRRAQRVEYLHNGTTCMASAGREVLLCAGAVNSPKVLLQSGIGPPEELGRLGISVQLDLPGVGRNLQDHLVLPLAFRTDPATLPAQTSSSPILIGFLRSPGSRWVDLEVMATIKPPDHLLVFIANLRTEAAGCVRLTSADPLVPPWIELNADPSGADAEKLIALARRVRRWVTEERLAGAELVPGLATVPIDASEAHWRMWLGVRLKGLYHPAGTCRMGPTGDPASVVDAELRVHGIPNLRVADCSIMPRVVAAHPSATAVMIGEKLAAMVEATRRASAA